MSRQSSKPRAASAYGGFIPLRQTAKQHLHWRKLKTYKTTYVPIRDSGSKSNPSIPQTIVVTSIAKPTKTRKFKSAGGIKKYKAVEVKSKFTEVIIVAKTKGRKKPIEDEELEELEAIEDLDELDEEEDEDVEDAEEVEEDDEDDEDEEDEEDDEDEDEDDEPAPKPRNKKAKSSKPNKSRSPRGSRPDDGKIGTQEVAEAAGVDGRALRIYLRKNNVEKDPDSSQYRWSSLSHPVVKKIIKDIKGGAVTRAKKEQLDNLRASKANKAKTSSTSTSSNKKKRAK